MESSPKVKSQVDTILKVDRLTSWGVGIIGVGLVAGFLIYASYWTIAEGVIVGMLYFMLALLLSAVLIRYRMWLRFVKNQTARKLLSFKMIAHTLAFSGIGVYGIFYFNSGPTEPQSFRMFLLSQLTFFGIEYLAKRFDRVIQSYDENYLTDKDIKEIREVREYEKEQRREQA
ncbi:hypothetical protein [Exiguobacterium qingdaonense]|uniref:hypothetical protein n=1 Tax=Exiguobacterium qingdaonense TaxID=2751251 RepID=UPI001BEA3873|nr:hypothetical protein [Exiguobacterium qingdaonense]